MTRLAAVFTPAVRRWLYGVGVAAVPLLVVYGVVNVEQGAAWVAFLGALVGMPLLGMAAANVRR